MTKAEPSAERRRAENELVRRVIASPSFARSSRLSQFLLYICECSFSSRLDEISEQQIGVQIFDRPPGYNPSEDSIVRSHARLLRQKLDAYFATEGRHEELRLTIPKGSYVPVFEPRQDGSVAAPAAEESNAGGPMADPRLGQRVRLRMVLACVTIGLICAGVGYAIGSFRAADRAPKPHPLWSRLFAKGRRTIFVPADTGFVMYQNLTRRSVGLMDYTTQNYRPAQTEAPDAAGKVAQDIGSRRYTTIVDLNFVSRLLRLPWAEPTAFQIRYARDVKLEDLKGANVILSGVAEANPWVQLFEHKLNFRFTIDETDRTFRVSNRHPQPGEEDAYFNSPDDPARRAYGLIAFQSGLTSGDDVLIAEGTTMAGTESAVDFALSDDALLPVLRRSIAKDGRLPYFEILLATTNMDGQAPRSDVIAVRRDSQ